jgi:tetratricopeptide (TPR) repeat protein
MGPVNSAAEQVLQLVNQSEDVGEGEEQISLLEEAVRIADLSGDRKLRYLARDQLVSACVFGGETDKALVAYSWCLAQFDQNPAGFSQWSILWKYKWMMGLIADFPQVSKEKLYVMMDDLELRIKKAGYGPRAIYNQRYRLEKFRDNKQAAIEYFRKMQAQPGDEVSNCTACEIDDLVSFHLYCGDDALGVELATPLIKGVEKCGSVPHRTYANLLLPLVRLGRQAEALTFHQRGYPLIENNKRYLDKIGDHIILLALTENFTRATGIFEQHYPSTEKSRDPFCRFRFFRAAAFLLGSLAARGQQPLNLNLPKSFPHYSPTGQYDAMQLAGWFEDAAREIGKRFDERNETDFFCRTLADTDSLNALQKPFPLV